MFFAIPLKCQYLSSKLSVVVLCRRRQGETPLDSMYDLSPYQVCTLYEDIPQKWNKKECGALFLGSA